MRTWISAATGRRVSSSRRACGFATSCPHRPVSLVPDSPVAEAVRLLLTQEFNGVPVVDQRGRVLGMVTQTDLLERAGIPLRLGLLAGLDESELENHLSPLEAQTVGEIMTKPAVTVLEGEQLIEAVGLMAKQRLKRIPVVDTEGILRGMLSRIDIFRTARCTPVPIGALSSRFTTSR